MHNYSQKNDRRIRQFTSKLALMLKEKEREREGEVNIVNMQINLVANDVIFSKLSSTTGLRFFK